MHSWIELPARNEGSDRRNAACEVAGGLDEDALWRELGTPKALGMSCLLEAVEYVSRRWWEVKARRDSRSTGSAGSRKEAIWGVSGDHVLPVHCSAFVITENSD